MQQFRIQLDFLVAHGYATPTMGELIAAPLKQWPRRTAVITFDDGYLDNFAACEELYQRGMRATWFIVSGSIGQPPKWPLDGRPAGRLLNASELCDMQSYGMEIGSHTVNHSRRRLSTASLIKELADSKAALEDLLGNAVSSFAYPYGALDARCVEAVQQTGYTAACTTRTGWALRDRNPYLLRRLTVFNGNSSSTLARKLWLASNDVTWSAMAGYGIQRIRTRAGL